MYRQIIISLNIKYTDYVTLHIYIYRQVRRRKKDRTERKEMKSRFILNLNNNLMSLLDGDSRHNTTLMEFTTTQYKRYKENSIHLSDMRYHSDNKYVYYNRVRYGKSLSTSKPEKRSGGNKGNIVMNINKSKGNMVFITAMKSEVTAFLPNAFCFGTVMTIKPDSEYDSNTPLSGAVILMMAMLPKFEDPNFYEGLWDEEVYQVSKKCKNNSLSSYSHHGTKGHTYSFGNKPLYGKQAGSSVGIYTNKTSNKKEKQEEIDINADRIENLCASAISKGVDLISTIIPEVRYFLSPILNAAFKKQRRENINVLQVTESTESGCWNNFLSVDGKTDNFHIEKDCSYTFITVPKQIMKTDLLPASRPYFIFKINEDVHVSLPLSLQLAFLYNANLLTHRQSYCGDTVDDNPKFYNVSCYSNEKNSII